MSRILSYRELNEGLIPDFATAVDILESDIGLMIEEGALLSAKIYGSVMKGSANIRSDLDFFAIFRDRSAVTDLRKLFQSLKTETNVTVEAALISERNARLGQHTIDDLFLEHLLLANAEGMVFGSNMSKIIVPSIKDPDEIFRGYISSKEEKITKNYVSPDSEERDKSLQRMLETPINAGRKFLISTGIQLPNDSKLTVAKTFQEQFRDNSRINTSFEGLLGLDAEYDANIGIWLAEGMCSQEQYSEYLNSLSVRAYPFASDFVSGLREHHQSLLEGKRQRVEGIYSGNPEVF